MDQLLGVIPITLLFNQSIFCKKRLFELLHFQVLIITPTPCFKLLGVIIFPDLVKYHITVFMYKYHNQLLPSVFNSFFTKVDQVHSYNTWHASKLSS